MEIGQYASASVALGAYLLTMAYFTIFFFPGGLAKFHSILSAWVSSLFAIGACLLLFTDFEVGSVERLVFHLLVLKAQFAYSHEIWDYLRLDDFIGSVQKFMIVSANGLIIFSSLLLDARLPGALTTSTTAVAWILFGFAPIVYILWAGMCYFFRHRIAHRENVVLVFALAYFIGYCIVFAVRSVSPVWVQVLCYTAVFVLGHIPGLLLTYWFDNLTKGLSPHPWFAKLYGYDNLRTKPSTEMLRQLFHEIAPATMRRMNGSASARQLAPSTTRES